jgi:multidrug efflux system membrane fusion protein
MRSIARADQDRNGHLVAIDTRSINHRHRASEGVVRKHRRRAVPNQFVNARVLIDVLHEAILAPAEAIARPAGTYVYVVKPDKVVQMRRVQLGPAGATISVRTGLTDSGRSSWTVPRGSGRRAGQADRAQGPRGRRAGYTGRARANPPARTLAGA